MRRGDIVQLKQPIQIRSSYLEEFTHGIIAARIKTKADRLPDEPSSSKSTIEELIIYAYNPETRKICLEEDGVPILFDVRISEVALFKAVKNRTDEIQDEVNRLEH
ncbi:hypothetical protein [Altericista sp. CCNU0014]|uniref:hypothetical protein n=1 Tax=Altericista sp. CCNU0014 TaxID=3082949 RepID=UPI00384AAA84